MEQKQDKTLTAATKTIQKPNNFEDEHRGVEGPMGRPAFFRGVTPGDLDTEGTNVPPIKGTPPRRRSINTRAGKDLLTPEGMGSALSRLCWPQHRQGQTDKHTWSTTITTYYRITLCTSTQTTARTRKRARAVSGGGREEAAEPNYPPLPPEKKQSHPTFLIPPTRNPPKEAGGDSENFSEAISVCLANLVKDAIEEVKIRADDGQQILPVMWGAQGLVNNFSARLYIYTSPHMIFWIYFPAFFD